MKPQTFTAEQAEQAHRSQHLQVTIGGSAILLPPLCGPGETPQPPQAMMGTAGFFRDDTNRLVIHVPDGMATVAHGVASFCQDRWEIRATSGKAPDGMVEFELKPVEF